ncbi:hypothetical protein [Phenylobacterium sp. RIFCSPHIGHO2_01_FULL_69_31]|jgi:hypothetical protein|uniref:hypothetical protein n=1 Tax=Phenylobacterium sp. RIFCSPHIGHO2_01_FULL_69_31 TaxID=1801944 RepID=UPI000A9B713C|nr:hypothetical protein [Phenylobacterium sp. RIFCSPHIGHO2_01_FULL_69_31]
MTAAAASPAASPPGRGTLSQTMIAGLAGGAVDLLYASGMSVASGQPAARPWQAVASGWIGGPAARDGGMAAVLLGVATHFGIALAMAAVYVLAARRVPALTARPMIAGALYGLMLYGVMYLVVLPLRWPGAFPSWQGAKSGLDILAHVAVGLVIAWTVSSRKARAA